jgi:prepilin-type N-terminal cleavage/methylation domain-containing protein
VRRKNGFTLIELLVVIAIVALLMAILVPVLRRARRQTGAVACQSNLHQWGVMFSMYATENDGKWFSWLFHDEIFIQPWVETMWPYYRSSSDVLLCATASKHTPRDAELYHWHGGKFSAWHWVWAPRSRAYGSYGLNNWVYHVPGQEKSPYPNSWHWKTVAVSGTGNIPVLLDSAWWGVWPNAEDSPPAYDGMLTGDWSENGCAMSYFCIDRHNACVNALFMDWSVRKVGLKQLWTLKWHREFDTAGPWTKAGGVKSEDWPQWMRTFEDY